MLGSGDVETAVDGEPVEEDGEPTRTGRLEPRERLVLGILVAVAALPPHLPDGPPQPRVAGVRRRLLFFGKVRRYKGVDVLLRALTRLRDVQLTIAGEVYPDAADLDALVDRLGLSPDLVV